MENTNIALLKQHLYNIADAIRDKNGSTKTIAVENMATEISNIVTADTNIDALNRLRNYDDENIMPSDVSWFEYEIVDDEVHILGTTETFERYRFEQLKKYVGSSHSTSINIIVPYEIDGKKVTSVGLKSQTFKKFIQKCPIYEQNFSDDVFESAYKNYLRSFGYSDAHIEESYLPPITIQDPFHLEIFKEHINGFLQDILGTFGVEMFKYNFERFKKTDPDKYKSLLNISMNELSELCKISAFGILCGDGTESGFIWRHDEITMPNTIESITEGAMEEFSLVLDINKWSNNLKRIEDYSFPYTEGSLQIEKLNTQNLEYIGNEALVFSIGDGDVKNLNFSKSIKYIGKKGIQSNCENDFFIFISHNIENLELQEEAFGSSLRIKIIFEGTDINFIEYCNTNGYSIIK